MCVTMCGRGKGKAKGKDKDKQGALREYCGVGLMCLWRHVLLWARDVRALYVRYTSNDVRYASDDVRELYMGTVW